MEWGLDTRVGKIARLRDLVVEEDLAEAGWREWEKRRSERRCGEREKKSRFDGQAKKVR